MDSDGRLWSLGTTWTTPRGWSVQVLSRYAKLNRGGAPDPWHTVSPTPVERWELVAGAKRRYGWGLVEVRLGGTYDEPAGTGRDLGLSGYVGFSRGLGGPLGKP